MIELPELVIQLIVERLSYEDLRNLRVTCKKLKVIVDRKTFRSLHLFVNEYPFERELFHSDELVSYANSFHLDDLAILKSLKFKSQFNRLLKLTINNRSFWSSNHFEVDLNDLNQFEELVHLELAVFFKKIEGTKLSLRNLKIAYFKDTETDAGVLGFELDCPQLKALRLGHKSMPRPTDETGHSIEALYVENAKEREESLFSLYAKLTSLSSIGFKFNNDLNNFVLALIEGRVGMPPIKQIKLKEDVYFPEGGVLLSNLASLKSRLETKHIEVRCNWKVMSSNDLIEMQKLLLKIIPPNVKDGDRLCFGLLDSRALAQFAENPALDCLLPSVGMLTLESNEQICWSEQFIGKFRNLARLKIGKDFVLSDHLFECMFRTWRKIHYLNIPYACFKQQQQLDLLPNYLQNIQYLDIRDEGGKLGDFDLDFVGKLKNLFILELNFNIKKDTMILLLQNCRPNFCLKLRGQQKVRILPKNKNARTEITCCEDENAERFNHLKKKEEFDSIEEAVEHYFLHDLFNRSFQDSNANGYLAANFQCSLS